MLLILTCVLFAYLIGSIPSAVWYGKTFFGVDIRDHGSGNAGATNCFRVLGKKAGIIVMLLDILKGFVASKLVLILLFSNIIEIDNIVIFKLILGIAAAVGHIFPVFANFRGGKAVATLFGMIVAIHPVASLLCVAVFLVIFLSFKYVSLGSILGAFTFSLLMLFPKFSNHDPALMVLGAVISFIILFTHKKNIVRLIKGDESKIDIGFGKKQA
jgi:acyl phosphate:glycerol-3-phosphate acyltransferase